VDPYATVREDMRSMADNLKGLVGSDHPVLRKIAAYFFDIEGKRIRPTILFLVCRALSLLSPQSPNGVYSLLS
jgi:geranylgeranyl pyrophosphate synthase